jgi:hypothetical protein
MKRLVLGIIGSLIFVGAQARPPTESEAVWGAMIDLASDNLAMKDLQDSGLGEAAVARVRDYCREALKQLTVSGKNLTSELCALKGASRAAIADQLEKMNRENKAQEENLIANLGVVLSADEESLFRDWARKYQSNTEILDDRGLPDLAYEVRTGSAEAGPVVDKACRALEADQQRHSATTEPN